MSDTIYTISKKLSDAIGVEFSENNSYSDAEYDEIFKESNPSKDHLYGEVHHMYGKKWDEVHINMFIEKSSGKHNAMYGMKGDKHPAYGYKFSEDQLIKKSGENHPLFGKNDHCHGLKKYTDGIKGKTFDEIHGYDNAKEIRKKLSNASKGRPQSLETRNKRSESMRGVPKSDEHKRKLSESKKGNPGSMKGKTYKKKECPHCMKIGGGSNMTRYHFDNCKELKIAKYN